MSCAGNRYLRTPNMDRLAERGVRFANAHCAAPLCTPARASMWTGLAPHQHGAVSVKGEHGQMREDVVGLGLGHHLTAAGYDCLYGGKWHAGQGGERCGIDAERRHGFARICGMNDHELPGACAEVLARRKPGDKPMFLVASFDDPHNICEWSHGEALPWGNLPDPPREEECPPLPANFAREPYQPIAVKRTYDQRMAADFDVSWDPADWRRYRWAYYRLVERVDARIGQVLDALEATGLDATTTIVFTSDHGEQAGSHGLQQKNVLYEESTRVPLIIARPDEPEPGRVVDDPVSAGLDLYPTVCDLTSTTAPDHCVGQSLVPLLDGKSLDRDGVLVEVCSMPNAAGVISGGSRLVRSHDHSYAVFHHSRPAEQFFDLSRDPGQMVNLATSATDRPELLRHRTMLRGWLERTNDRLAGVHYAFAEVPDRHLLPGDEWIASDT
ncbi:MAG: sulfatase-like hydrolase/transferase, partial [Planctomycetota bacterium]